MSEHTCGCGHEDCNCEEVQSTVTLTLDNDEVVECAILTIYEAGEHSYIALLPLDEDGEQANDDVYLYRFIEPETEDGEPTLENIENDDEYEVAADAFDEWLDSLEYDDLDVEE